LKQSRGQLTVAEGMSPLTASCLGGVLFCVCARKHPKNTCLQVRPLVKSVCAHRCEHSYVCLLRGVGLTNLIRIGDKVVDRDRIDRALDKLFDMRQNGASQAEVAAALGTDRSFVSRLENLGEIRKGERVAVIGFPIGNKEEIEQLAKKAGVDYVWLMNDEERWAYVEDRSGIELLNDVIREISDFNQYDQVIFLGSDFRVRLIEAILGEKVTSVVIGESPIKEDVNIDVAEMISIIKAVRGGAEKA
jgi:transcriptional regulator with XRE-family HTH domain